MPFSVGTDPEMFLQNTQGKIVPSIPFIKGTKYEPLPMKTGGGLSRDNVAVEFSTPPVKEHDEFINIVRDSLLEVCNSIPRGYDIVIKASHIFNKRQLSHPEARRFGCDPDFDAWRLTQNNPASPDVLLRSCGGHVHVGRTKPKGFAFLDDTMNKIEMVRLLDATLGITSCLLDTSPEANSRRQLYGKAGCHRPTFYGLEYRVLSNFWISSPQLVSIVYRIVDTSLRLKEENLDKDIINCIGESLVQTTINSGNIEVAKAVFYGVLCHYFDKQLIKDIESVSVNPFEFKKEWSI